MNGHAEPSGNTESHMGSTVNGTHAGNGHAVGCGPTSADPIAIIGMSLKFPGKAVDCDSFWKMLLEKHCASTEFPKDRLNIDAFYHPDPKRQNKARRQYMSVHVGCFTSDFMSMDWKDSQQIPKYSATGSTTSILANRISWFFDLRGPSMLVDTACSSAMIALDLACQGLKSGTSNAALVAGANLICSPEMNIALSNMSMLSPDGRCHSFDHRANGYARGDGFGVLVLKTLSQALKDGDSIRALIRSVGTNQDGHTPGGITQPSQELQAQLIRETYHKAGLDMGLTRFFEAHGTGTAIGDPTEARAIGECFRMYRSPAEPLYVGAVKSNIGHLEGASGIAGIIKAVLVLEKGMIPPNANFERLNPNIDAEFMNLEFPAIPVPWPSNGPRRASVNSFGFGGSNAHVILDDAFHYLLSHNLISDQRMILQTSTLPEVPVVSSNGSTADSTIKKSEPDHISLLTFSAADGTSASRLAETYSHYLQDPNVTVTPELLQDIAFTLNARRTSFTWRTFAVLGQSTVTRLGELVAKPVKAGSDQGLGFVFTGQGAQWYAMGHELMKDENTSRVAEAEISQALSTAIQIALVDSFQWLGVAPSVVVGHSSGEIAAAYCAGFISHRSAIKAAYHRGVLASRLAASRPIKRTMVAVGLSQEEITVQLAGLSGMKAPKFNASLVTLSCINSPSSVTVSGPVEQMDSLVTHLESQGIFARRLKVNVAYHSPQMEPIVAEYLEAMGQLERGSKKSKVRMMSSVSGEIVREAEVCNGRYWVKNLLSPVNFLQAMKLCCILSSESIVVKKLDRSHYDEVSSRLWVEIGPHSALAGPIRDILKSIGRTKDVFYCSSLVRKQPANVSFLTVAGHLWSSGFRIDSKKFSLITQVSSHRPELVSDLPPYPFDHSRLYWKETLASQGFRFRRHARHSLLGAPMDGSGPLEARWKFIIAAEELPWIKDHKINGSILYPAAGMLTMAIEASKSLSEDQSPVGFEIKDAEFSAPILITSLSEAVETYISLSPVNETKSEHRFKIVVQKSNTVWEQVCEGSVRADYGRMPSDVNREEEEVELAKELRSLHTSESWTGTLGSSDMYNTLKDIGLDYGPTFQALDEVRYSDCNEAMATVLPYRWCEGVSEHPEETKRMTVHPTTLDSLFQLSFVAMSQGGQVPLGTMVPTRVSKVWVSSLGIGKSVSDLQTVHCRTERTSRRLAQSHLSVLTQSAKELRVLLEGLELTSVSSSLDALQAPQKAENLCHHLCWSVDLDLLSDAQVHQYCEAARNTKPDPVDEMKDLETLSLYFGAQALQQLKELDRIPIEAMERYTTWLQRQLDHYLAEDSGDKHQSKRDLLYGNDHLREIRDRMATANRNKELFVKIGLQLPQILLGEVDALQILFDDEQLLADLYTELISDSSAFDAVSTYLDTVVQKQPSMSFLEIGAGTGATTDLILNTIGKPAHASRYGEYVFTDLSSSFFATAQGRFGTHKRMSYRTLNIEQDPLDQGFDGEGYDVVIASMVLHATRSLVDTLKNVRKLLKPGGKLILVELVAPEKTWVGFVFGLLPGWWLSSEGYRNLSPCIVEQDWNDLLLQTGFSGVDVNFKDYETEDCRGWSALIATASPDVTRTPEASKATVILDTRSSDQQHMAEQIGRSLKQQGDSMDLCTLSEAASLEDISTRHFIMIRDLETPLLPDIDSESFSALQRLLTCAGRILWVTRGGNDSVSSVYHAMADGLCRTSCEENQSVSLVKLALATTKQASAATDIAHIVNVFRSSTWGHESGTIEPELLEMDGLLHINRTRVADKLDDHIFERTTEPVRLQEFGAGFPLKLNVKTPGLLDSMEFIEDQDAEKPLAPEEVLIEVRAIGLNFKDCLAALGKFHTDILGCDCAGVIVRTGEAVTAFKPGDRVYSGASNTFRTLVRAHHRIVMKMPEDMSFAEGASFPTAFLTAYHSLHKAARLEKHESILIHAAAGGTGQAAVQMALDIGAEIFALVGSLGKKKLLMEVYNIPEDHIFYSRDSSFADGIRRMTHGRGVDVVFSSLSGDGLLASWELVAPFGRFVEIGRNYVSSRTSLPMYPFRRNVTFIGFDLTGILERHIVSGNLLEEFTEMMKKGTVKAAHPLQVYPLAEIEQAFRTLSSGKSSGKMVLEVTKDAMVPVVQGPRSNWSLRPDASYVVVGGFGGIGRNICRWLATRGAKYLLLLSRSGPVGNEKALALIDELQSKGVVMECPSCDVADVQSLNDTISRCSKTLPPIKGCFQTSMVLRDSIFGNMAYDDWVQSTRPKVQGTWNLHTALPPAMDFFVILSSLGGVIANGGQSNYAAGNTFQDAFAHHRCLHGEKAIALDLGIFLTDGVVADNDHIMKHLLRKGVFRPVEPQQLFALLDYYCDPSRAVPPATRVNEAQCVFGVYTPADSIARGIEIVNAMRVPLIRQMHRIDPSSSSSSSSATTTNEQTSSTNNNNPTHLFATAPTFPLAALIVTQALQSKLAKVLGLPLADIELTHRIESYG
ncbi:MAG: hypothetical protein Q9212_003778, partial [Teloschistes hypoglaucus]